MHDLSKSDNSSVIHSISMTSPSICQSCITSVCHAMKTSSPSICQSNHLSVCHTVNETSRQYVSHIFHLSVIPSYIPVCLYVTCMTHLSANENVIPSGSPSGSQCVCCLLHPSYCQLKSWWKYLQVFLCKISQLPYTQENSLPFIHQLIHLSIQQAVCPSPHHCLLKNH